jgi:tyrosine decarboxylase/aspartate 1-decarboxylase
MLSMGTRKHSLKKAEIFPKIGMPSWRIKLYLRQTKNKLKGRKPEQFLGWLYTLPHSLSTYAYAYFIDQNPSHLGSWAHSSVSNDSTQKMEQEVIKKLTNLYHADPEVMDGYVTSGGTESNLFSVWVGRTYLEKFAKKDRICLLRTDLSHYSVNKSARIAGVKDFVVPLDDDSWGMSPEGFEITLQKLIKNGNRGFLVPITLGYTSTGSSDNLSLIDKIITRLKKTNKDIHFFIWIDAALNGLTLPFITKNFSPFKTPGVQTLCIDFHKLGLVPYPAGIILYRKSLKKLIAQAIDYLPQKDETVSGSRPGSSAVAIWSMIHHMGFEGYKNIIDQCREVKRSFVERLKTVDPLATTISDDSSIHIGVIFSIPIEKFNTLRERFGLFANKAALNFYVKGQKKYTLYKFYFLPGITKSTVNKFFDALNTNLTKQ